MLAFREDDGSDFPSGYTHTTDPGKWRPTLPGFSSAAFPQWGQLESFALPRNDLFRPQPPPVLSSSAYALELRWVKEIGGSDSTLRTADESEIANFWADGGATENPPGHWLDIAGDVSDQQSLGMQDRARLFALISLATADAAIVAWDAKYVYDLWRPITAIREADTDENASTTSDPTWLPYISTPPFPEYVSGHSTFSRSATTVMAAFFGTDEIPFTTGSDALPEVLRSYPGFSAAADEAGVSRIYVGIHFASGTIAGQSSAFGLGTLVANNFLAPLSDTEFSLVRHSPDGLQLEVQVTNGATYRVEASSDMQSWETLTTITAGSSTISFLDANAPAGKRFYRLVELP
ncbi:MAG: vanadium-dependent haloperoxidase [Akkermansiaceae bacterium]